MSELHFDPTFLAERDASQAAFVQQIADRYHPLIAETLLTKPYTVPLSRDSQLTMDYVVSEPLHRTVAEKIVYVSGFGEGILNKLPFAAELASQGAEVLLSEPVRKGYAPNRFGDKNPIDTQASDILDLIRHETGDEPVALVAHSMGALTVARMVAMQPERFAASSVVMLAPSGTAERESYASLAKRWMAFATDTRVNEHREIADPYDVTPKASQLRLMTDKRRTVREMQALRSEVINYHRLADAVGRVAIMPYAADSLYPMDRYESTIQRLLTKNPPENLSWITPVTFELFDGDKQPLVGRYAQHADEELNPTRVASTVIDYLRP